VVCDSVIEKRSQDARNAKKLDPLLRYVTSVGCRRDALLRHFGEYLKECSGCDRCARWPRFWKGREAWKRARRGTGDAPGRAA
jgi:superfamily II DNA helicase RecQ